MEGTLQNKLSEEYESKLTTGSVLVLRNFNILTTNFGRSHYLYITQKNIVAICNNINGRLDFVKLQDVDLKDIKEKVESVTVQNGASYRVNIPLEHCKYRNSSEKSVPQINYGTPLRINASLEHCKYKNSTEKSASDINFQSVTKTPQETSVNSFVKKKFDFKSMKTNNKFNDNIKNHKTLTNQNVNNIKSVFDGSFSEANLSLNDANSGCKVHIENLEHSQILQTAFDGVDLENFFDDF